MKKQQQQEQDQEHIEILKAVAQAWHGHSSSSKASDAPSEFDAHRRYFKGGKPTRFRLEAMSMATKNHRFSTSWDFRQSLWDSYEIVAVSKRLEEGLVLDADTENPSPAPRHGVKRRKESRNSLRSLFDRMSSRRFSEEETRDL
ncbi:uncharacterized protein LOC127246103 [Andrographis paniculata]|uniref:uncharacterized protein LOC127246103 n=1 Tax=Andrographis paniculata TaxID=175694 RepID=UPI0021E83C28|nr:uncharacterized protein LOC127246103 [Andrographis paniculata]